MKKNLFVLGMIAVSSTVVWAKEIGFDTPVKWNSKVIENALTSAGFIDSDGANWDVKTTRNRILENLLSRDMFSLHDATDVCMEKCNMSDFLRKGRGQSGKKCPELCTTFVENIIKENNKQFASIPGAGKSDTSFSGLEDNSRKVCIKLASDAVNSGLAFPVLCGGTCKPRGDDIVRVTDLEKTKEYKVDDFCDGQKSGDYFYVVSGNKQATDVSSLNEQKRIAKLKEIQTKPASDYIQEQVVEEKETRYAKRLKQNGYCALYEKNVRGPELDQVDRVSSSEKDMMKRDCRTECYKHAQANACRIREVYYSAVAAYGILIEKSDAFPAGNGIAPVG